LAVSGFRSRLLLLTLLQRSAAAVVPTRDAENRGKGFIALQLDAKDPSDGVSALLVIINSRGELAFRSGLRQEP